MTDTNPKIKIDLNSIAIFVIIAIGLLYYNVVLKSPIIFGDEGNYASVSRDMIKNMIFPKEWTFVTSYHMSLISKPIFYLMESFGWLTLGELGVKLIIPVFSILTAMIMYLFLREFENKLAGLISAIVFLLTPSLITYGVLGYSDTLLCMFTILFTYFFYKSFKTDEKKYQILAGIFFGLSILTKVTILFFNIPFIIVYCLIFNRNQWKKIIIVLIFAAIIIAPWYFIRNPILFGNICYDYISTGQECYSHTDIIYQNNTDLKFEGRNPGSGTEANIFDLGLLNYFRFAYGWAIPIILLLSLSFIYFRKSKLDKFLLIYFIIQLPFLFYLGTRAEDAARYMLPLLISISTISGIFISNIFEQLKKYHILLGILMLVIILYFTWIYGQEKLSVMESVKSFVPGVFDACKWMKQNTQQDAILFATYGQQVSYQCDRKVSYTPNGELILLTGNDTSFENIKLNNITHIYIIEGLISQQTFSENTPKIFVDYVESSDHFKLVYDNRNIYGQAGVRIYEVLY